MTFTFFQDEIQRYFLLWGAVTSLLVITYLIMRFLLSNDERDRSVLMKGVWKIIIGAIAMTSFLTLYQGFATWTLKEAEKSSVVFDSNTTSEINFIVEDDEDGNKVIGFFENGFYSVLDMLMGFLIDVRETLYGGREISIQSIVFEDSKDIVYNLNVREGKSLYKLMTDFGLIPLLIGFLSIGLYVVLGAADDSYDQYARQQAARFAQAMILMALSPFMIKFVEGIVSTALDLLNVAAFGVNTEEIFNIENNGIEAYIARLYMFYLEFKIFVSFLIRAVVVNAAYVMAPISIGFWAANKEFVSLSAWINVMLKYLLLPIYYAVAYIIATSILVVMPYGDNIFVIIIILGTIPSTANILQSLIMIKAGGSHAPNASSSGAGIAAVAGAGLASMGTLMGGKSGASAAAKTTTKALSSASKSSSMKQGASQIKSAFKSFAGTNIGKTLSNSKAGNMAQSISQYGGKGMSYASNSVKSAVQGGLDKLQSMPGASGVMSGVKSTAKNVGDVAKLGGQVSKSVGSVAKNAATSKAGKAMLKTGVGLGAATLVTAATGNPLAGAGAFVGGSKAAGKGLGNMNISGSTVSPSATNKKAQGSKNSSGRRKSQPVASHPNTNLSSRNR